MNSQYYCQTNSNNNSFAVGNYRLPLIETQRVFQDSKKGSSASGACIQFGPDTIVEIGSPIYLCDQESRSNSSLNKASKKIAKNYPVVQESPKKASSRRHNKVRNPWSPKEDLKLMDLMKKYGQSWAMISSLMDGRTGKQVRDRYLNKLRPNIRCGDWSQREDDLLITLCKEIGNRWSLIATHLPGRTEAQVKNRYYSSIKKRIEGGNESYNPIFDSKTNSDKVTSFESSPQEENGFEIDYELDFDAFNCESNNQATFDNVAKVSYVEEERYSENTATSPQNSSEYTYEANNEIPFDNEEALVFARNSSFLLPSFNPNEIENNFINQSVDSFFAPENVIFQRGNSVFPVVQEEIKDERFEQLKQKKTYLELALAKTMQELSSL